MRFVYQTVIKGESGERICLGRIRRVQLHEILEDPSIRDEKRLWVDHVLYDIPQTVANAVRHAPPNVVRFTVHEDLLRGSMWLKYAEVWSAARERGAEIYVALSGGGFERVPLEYFAIMRREILEEEFEA